MAFEAVLSAYIHKFYSDTNLEQFQTKLLQKVSVVHSFLCSLNYSHDLAKARHLPFLRNSLAILYASNFEHISLLPLVEKRNGTIAVPIASACLFPLSLDLTVSGFHLHHCTETNLVLGP